MNTWIYHLCLTRTWTNWKISIRKVYLYLRNSRRRYMKALQIRKLVSLKPVSPGTSSQLKPLQGCLQPRGCGQSGWCGAVASITRERLKNGMLSCCLSAFCVGLDEMENWCDCCGKNRKNILTSGLLLKLSYQSLPLFGSNSKAFWM